LTSLLAGGKAGIFVGEPPRLKFLWYKVGKDYRWRLVAGNDEILCSGQGYSRKKDMMSTIDLIKRAAMAEVREVEG
jgi:uncharacterized protein YegP (UPF0339 family)